MNPDAGRIINEDGRPVHWPAATATTTNAFGIFFGITRYLSLAESVAKCVPIRRNGRYSGVCSAQATQPRGPSADRAVMWKRASKKFSGTGPRFILLEPAWTDLKHKACGVVACWGEISYLTRIDRWTVIVRVAFWNGMMTDMPAESSSLIFFTIMRVYAGVPFETGRTVTCSLREQIRF